MGKMCSTSLQAIFVPPRTSLWSSSGFFFLAILLSWNLSGSENTAIFPPRDLSCKLFTRVNGPWLLKWNSSIHCCSSSFHIKMEQCFVLKSLPPLPTNVQHTANSICTIFGLKAFRNNSLRNLSYVTFRPLNHLYKRICRTGGISLRYL